MELEIDTNVNKAKNVIHIFIESKIVIAKADPIQNAKRAIKFHGRTLDRANINIGHEKLVFVKAWDSDDYIADSRDDRV